MPIVSVWVAAVFCCQDEPLCSNSASISSSPHMDGIGQLPLMRKLCSFNIIAKKMIISILFVNKKAYLVLVKGQNFRFYVKNWVLRVVRSSYVKYNGIACAFF